MTTRLNNQSQSVISDRQDLNRLTTHLVMSGKKKKKTKGKQNVCVCVFILAEAASSI